MVPVSRVFLQEAIQRLDIDLQCGLERIIGLEEIFVEMHTIANKEIHFFDRLKGDEVLLAFCVIGLPLK